MKVPCREVWKEIDNTYLLIDRSRKERVCSDEKCKECQSKRIRFWIFWHRFIKSWPEQILFKLLITVQKKDWGRRSGFKTTNKLLIAIKTFTIARGSGNTRFSSWWIRFFWAIDQIKWGFIAIFFQGSRAATGAMEAINRSFHGNAPDE